MGEGQSHNEGASSHASPHDRINMLASVPKHPIDIRLRHQLKYLYTLHVLSFKVYNEGLRDLLEPAKNLIIRLIYNYK